MEELKYDYAKFKIRMGWKKMNGQPESGIDGFYRMNFALQKFGKALSEVYLPLFPKSN